MDAAASQFMRALRAHRSQVAFSRRLGYRSNVAADWEQGRRFPTATEALRAATLMGVDCAAAFHAFHAPTAPGAAQTMDDDEVAQWLCRLRGSRSTSALARRNQLSRHALARWFKGDSRPRLPDFLRLVDALTGRVQDLLVQFVPEQTLPVFAERFEQGRASLHVGEEQPWALLVLMALETRAYTSLKCHDTGFLARYLEMPPERVEAALTTLVRAGVVVQRGGRFQPHAPFTIDTQNHPEVGRAMKTWFADLGAQRVRNARPADVLSYNLFAVSKADLARIQQMQRVFYRDVRSVVAESEVSEVVALLNVQLVCWQSPISPDGAD